MKTTVEGAKTTTTLYVGGIVYQNDTLQFIGHEEGRVRWTNHRYLNGATAYGFEYDYFLKDHLGNTRMVLTQEKDTAKYMATMEAAYRTTENQLFYNIPQSSYPRASVSGYLSAEGVGLRSYVEFNLKKTFYATGGFEYNYQQTTVSSQQTTSEWLQSGLIGISKVIAIKSKMFKKTKVQLLWDFLSYEQPIRTQPLKFRVGYGF